MPLSMMALRERFIQHPLLPTAVVEQQNRWRERWGMQPKSPEPGEDWRYYFDPTKLHGGRPDANDEGSLPLPDDLSPWIAQVLDSSPEPDPE